MLDQEEGERRQENHARPHMVRKQGKGDHQARETSHSGNRPQCLISWDTREGSFQTGEEAGSVLCSKDKKEYYFFF